MKDRAPLYPGRVKLAPVAGQENVYDMTREDRPTQLGTPLNKATFLKDATAALYGLGADAVPDDVLAWIGKYNQYWWKRRVYTVAYEISLSTASSNVFFSNNYVEPNTVYYATDIEISSDGVVSLKNPQTLTCPRGTQSGALDLLTAVKGMYVCNTLGSTADIAVDSTTVYLISSSATFSFDGNGNPYTASANAQKVSTYPVNTIGEWVYTISSDRNAYPDSGISDGYDYQYLGVPFENAVTAPKIATGSYVGTGTYGNDNPCSLTFDFVPKLVFVCGGAPSYSTGEFIMIRPDVVTSAKSTYGNLYSGIINKNTYIYSYGNTVYWYDTESKHNQYNASNGTYYYVGIG